MAKRIFIYLVCLSVLTFNLIGCGRSGPAKYYQEVQSLSKETNVLMDVRTFKLALAKSKEGLSKIEFIRKNFPDWKRMDLLVVLEDTFNKNLNYCEAAVLTQSAYSAFLQGEYEEALEKYKRALNMIKDYAPVDAGAIHRRLGDIYVRQGKYEEALEEYNIVLEKYKGQSRYITALTLVGIGKVKIFTGKYEEAIKIQESVLNEYQDVTDASVSAQYGIGDIYQRMGKYEQALKAWKELIAKYPRHSFTPMVKYLTDNFPIEEYKNIDKYGAALPFVVSLYTGAMSDEDFLSTCLKLGEKYEPAAFFFLGVKYEMKKQKDKAIEYFQKSLAVSKEKDFMYNMASKTLEKMKGN